MVMAHPVGRVVLLCCLCLGVVEGVQKPQLISEVDTVSDAFKWVEHNFAVLADWQGTGMLDRIGRAMDGLRVSSAFSGTGGSENVLDALAAGVQHFSPDFDGKRPSYSSEWCCEYFDESRYELRMLRHRPKHVFGDMTDFLHLGFREDLRKQAPRMSWQGVERLFTSQWRKLLTNRAPCDTCAGINSCATCEASRCHLHIAGSPCVAWSSRGKGGQPQARQHSHSSAGSFNDCYWKRTAFCTRTLTRSSIRCLTATWTPSTYFCRAL